MRSSDPALPVGRYAPSPTGSLHLGNLRTALAAYCFTRSRGGRFLLRIEDIDLPRIRAGMEAAQLHDLRLLGMDWDEEPLRQSERSAVYADYLDRLIGDGHAYRCFCSRRDIQLALSAPHREDEVHGYPGTCRHLSPDVVRNYLSEGRQFCWRVRVDQAPKEFHDGFCGSVAIDLEREAGDFVVRRADGLFAYQLACAVDDALSGVTEVLRGDDLLDSGARQQWLLHLLKLPIPQYYHIPLMLDENGNRLSKRTGAADLTHYLSTGHDIPSLIGSLAETLGQCEAEERITIRKLIDAFDLKRVPRKALRIRG